LIDLNELQMIKDAIVSLKERTGSSQYAIAKFIEEKHKQLPSNFKKLLLQNLKKNVASGKLVKVKGSFKLSSATPKPKTTKPDAKVKAVKAKPAVKPKAKAVVKPKTKSVTAKPKSAAAVKPKSAATKPKAAATKPKAAATKPKAAAAAKAKTAAKAKPNAKVAKTTTRTSPGKKGATAKPAAKKVAAAKKKAPVKNVKPRLRLLSLRRRRLR